MSKVSKKKILIILDSLAIGGSQENILTFIENMKEYDITILSCFGDDHYSDKIKLAGGNVKFLSHIKGNQIVKIFLMLYIYVRFIFFNLNCYDVIILRLPFVLLMCSIFRVFKRKNTIFDVDCTYYQLNFYEKKIFNKYLNKYKYILLPNEMKESFKCINFSKSKIYDDLAFVNYRFSNNPIVYKARYNFLFIARLIPQKGLKVAIEIIKKYNEHYGNLIDLHVIGDGVDLKSNKDFCEQNNISFVKFYGYKLNLDDYIENIDALIKTSFFEPINSTARELLNKGKIVFAVIDIAEDRFFLNENLIHEIYRDNHTKSINNINNTLFNFSINNCNLIRTKFNERYGNDKAKEFYTKLFEEIKI